MDKFITFKQFQINEKKKAVSGEVLDLKRGEWTKIDPDAHPELADEFFDLIKTAYKEIGGNAKVKKPSDVFKYKDIDYWEGVDLHGSPDLDLIVFGKNTKFGVKFSGVGHDGQKDSKREYLDGRAKDLSTMGYYGEVSGKFAEILFKKYGVPAVSDENKVKQILKKDFEWHGKHPTNPDASGEGWYSRKIGGEMHTKILVGNPTV